MSRRQTDLPIIRATAMFTCLLLLSSLTLSAGLVSDISHKVLHRQQDPSITASYYSLLQDRRAGGQPRKDLYNSNLAELLRMSTGPMRPRSPF